MQVFQRRKDGREDFYRDWKDYKSGFGQLDSEHWLGEEPRTFICYELRFYVSYLTLLFTKPINESKREFI